MAFIVTLNDEGPLGDGEWGRGIYGEQRASEQDLIKLPLMSQTHSSAVRG